MAGYSGTPLPRKLGVKDDHLVLLDGLPPGVDLGDLGAAEVVTRLPRRPLDLTVTFHTRLAPLRARLPLLIERTAAAGMIWVCWPKKTARAAVDDAPGADAPSNGTSEPQGPVVAKILFHGVSALDPGLKARTLELIARVQARTQIPMIFISHAPEEVRRLCDRVVTLHEGRVQSVSALSGAPVRPVRAVSPDER